MANDIMLLKAGPVTKAGPLARVTQAVSAAYNAFFGPGVPLPQQAPAGTPPRSQDYQSYVNLSYSPRSTEQVSFDQLRSLADSYYLVRSVIETRKDQIANKEWHFSLKPKSDESQAAGSLRSENDARVKKLTAFFQRPDGIHNWHTWLRMLIEDMLVIDAATLLPIRSRGGDILKLVPVDGATIKPVLSPMGVVPDDGLSTAYQQIIKGMILAELTTKELIYVPRNPRTNKIYGFSPVEQLIILINLGIRRTIHQLDYYTEGSVPEAVVQVPESWSSDQIKQFQQWFDAALTGNLAGRRRMTFVPSLGGANAINWAKDPKLTDEMDELLARATCFVFSIPPTPFVRQMNRATAQQANETALKEGQEPAKLWVKNLIDYIVQSPDFFGESKVEFTFDDDVNIDKVKQAQIDDYDLRNGKRSVDELRERDGLEKIGVGNGVYTANGFVPFEHAIQRSQQALDAGAKAAEQISNGDGNDAVDESGNGKTDKGKTASGAAVDAEASDTKGEKKPAPAVTKAATVKKKVLVPTDKLPGAVEKRITTLAGSLARFLKTQGKKISGQIAEAYAEVTKDDQDEVDRIIAEIDLEWAALVGSMETAIAQTAQESGKATLTDVGVQEADVFNQVNQAALDFAKDRAAELVGMKYVDGELVENPNPKWAITETTRAELKQIVTRAFSEGMTPVELENAIRDSFQFSKDRASMIARTEMAKAHVQGTLESAKATGLAVRKFSDLSGNHDLDDECDDNADAGEIAFNEMFPSGDDGPPFHPNAVLEGSTFLGYGRVQQMLRARYDGPAITLEAEFLNDDAQSAATDSSVASDFHERNVSGEHFAHQGNLLVADLPRTMRPISAERIQLTVGPNHPILTRRGFVHARFLNEGDELVYDSGRKSPSTTIVSANLEDVPLVEDVFESLRAINGCTEVASAHLYFHGDECSIYGKVEAVRPTRSLLIEHDSGLIKHLCKCPLTGAYTDAEHVASCGGCQSLFEAAFSSTTCFMGRAGAGEPLLGGRCAPIKFQSLRIVARHNISFSGWAFDASTSDTVYASNGIIVKNCNCSLSLVFEMPTEEAQ